MNVLMFWVKFMVAACLAWTQICDAVDCSDPNVVTHMHAGDVDAANYMCLPTIIKESCETSSSINNQQNSYNYEYPMVSFVTTGATKKSFKEFIEALRNLLVSGLPPVHEIARTREPSTVTDSQRFVLVNLANSNEHKIILAIDVTNLYVVGYRTGDVFYYFPDTAQHHELIYPTITHTELPFGSNYGDLAHEAGNRDHILLGMSSLEQAIEDLHEYIRDSLARAFTIVIQMVAEAARFRYIENFLQQIIINGNDIVPDRTTLSLENKWRTLSGRIQHAPDGIIDPPVPLIDRYGSELLLSSVTPGIVLNLAIMLFVCTIPNHDPMLLSTQPKSASLGDHGGICTDIPEPTIRIGGRNGFCADVYKEWYNNGNPIVLWPCKSNEDANQLWTRKSDGTIQSKGKCLTTYGYSPGSYIMIYNCLDAVPDAAKWEIWDNGTIINPRSSLVLSATSGDAETTLTLQANVYAASQGWVVSNNTKLIVTPLISNYNNLCIQLSYGDTVTVLECVTGEKKQEWVVYPDQSLRPNSNRDYCLTAKHDASLYNDPCDGSAGQRWLFNRDETISNLDTKLVLEVEEHHVSLNPNNDKPSQKWSAWLL